MKLILFKIVNTRKEIYSTIWREYKLKKIITAIITAALLFSPVGNVIFQDQSTTVEAKSYKSGKRGFNLNGNNNNTNNNSLFQNKKADSNKSNATTNKSTTTTKQKGGFMSGGLMKGLMLGGLAGLLFGSLFANMGILGSILGLFINVFAIIILFSLIRRIFVFFKDKKKKEEPNPWRG